jgi:hypothetical protein
MLESWLLYTIFQNVISSTAKMSSAQNFFGNGWHKKDRSFWIKITRIRKMIILLAYRPNLT